MRIELTDGVEVRSEGELISNLITDGDESWWHYRTMIDWHETKILPFYNKIEIAYGYRAAKNLGMEMDRE